jgi:hypothetical protein
MNTMNTTTATTVIATVIAAILAAAPKGAYHIKVRTPGGVYHATKVDGAFHFLTRGEGEAQEPTCLAEVEEALREEGLDRVDYLVYPALLEGLSIQEWLAQS